MNCLQSGGLEERGLNGKIKVLYLNEACRPVTFATRNFFSITRTSTESAGRILELAFRCGQPEFSKKGALIERNIMYFIRQVFCVQKRGSISNKIS
jgi:hypothetical protein